MHNLNLTHKHYFSDTGLVDFEDFVDILL